MTVKRRTVALKFSCGLNARELKTARQLLDEAAGLSAVAEGNSLVHSLRQVNVTEGAVELVVSLDGYGSVANGVQKTIEIVDSILAPRQVDGSKLSLLSAKIQKA